MKKQLWVAAWPDSEKEAREHFINDHSAAADEMSPKDFGKSRWSAVHRAEHAENSITKTHSHDVSCVFRP